MSCLMIFLCLRKRISQFKAMNITNDKVVIWRNKKGDQKTPTREERKSETRI